MASISVVYDESLALLNVPDGVVIDVETPPLGILAPGGVNAVAFEGTAIWGGFDTVAYESDPVGAARDFGAQQPLPTDLMTYANFAFALGVKDVRLNRIGDGTQSAAVLPLQGQNGPFLNLVGFFPGSRVNPAQALFTYSATTPPSMMQPTGNAQKVFVDLTLSGVPNANPEIFQNLDGNVPVVVDGVTTYSIDPVALAAAVTAAVNNGQPNGSAASAYWVASPSTFSNPGTPIIAVPNTVATPGTDGSAFAAGSPLTLDQAMLGTNTVTPPTGMYAFSGQLSGAALALCGCNDIATISGLAATFAKSQNGRFVVAFPNGTSSASALATKTALGIGDFSEDVFAGDWPIIIDSVNGAIQRYVDPAPLACARYAITAPNESPANLSMSGLIVGTFRTNQTQSNPYGDDEVLQLENAGINFFSNDTAGGVGFAIRHNKNSLGKTAGYRGNIAYGRMIQFLVASYKSKLLGASVGKNNTVGTRKSMTTLFNAFLGELQDNGIINGYTVVCNQTNNPPGTPMLRVDTTVDQNGIIDVVAVGLVSGVGILASVQPLPNAA